MNNDEIEQARRTLADALANIDARELDATPAERAYISGALHTLARMLQENDPDDA